MRIARALLPCLLALALAAPLGAAPRSADPPVDPEMAKRIAPLVERLDAPTFEERESATRALRELGPEAEAALRAAEANASPETRLRIGRILLHYREIARRATAGVPEAGDWPMLRRNPGRSAGEGPALRTVPEPVWSCELPARLGKPWFDDPFLVVDRRLVVVARDGTVVSVDRETGRIEWVAKTGEKVFAGPVLAAGTIYVPGPGLTALDAENGTIRWHWPTDYGVIATPLVHEGMVFAVEKGERIAALDPLSGKPRWRTRIDGTRSSPVPAGKLVLVGTGRGLQALRTADGSRRWLAETTQPVDTPPVVLPDRVVFADASRALHAVSLDHGMRLWRRRFPEGEVAGTPAVYGDVILFPTTGATFRAVHADDGRDLWTRFIGTVNVSSASVVDGTLYLTGGSMLCALECADGDDAFRLLLLPGRSLAAPVVLDGTCYLAGMDGVLTAYR